jgi:hypothetical protein
MSTEQLEVLAVAAAVVSTTVDHTVAPKKLAKAADNHLPTDRTDLLQLVADMVVLILVVVVVVDSTDDQADPE